ncbi:telomere length regulation protein-domain-containing protein, partial [Blyttiomyces helicus]
MTPIGPIIHQIQRDLSSTDDLATVKCALSEPLTILLGCHSSPDRHVTLHGSRYLSSLSSEDLPAAACVFRRTHLARHLDLLLSSVSVNWLPLLTDSERRVLFDPYFGVIQGTAAAGVSQGGDGADIHAALGALVRAIAKKEHSFSLQVSVGILEALLSSWDVGAFLRAATQSGVSSETPEFRDSLQAGVWEQYISTVVAIPERVANACERTYRKAAPAMLSLLAAKLSRLGYSDMLADQWLLSLQKSIKIPPTASLWKDVFAPLPPREAENILASFLRRFAKETAQSDAHRRNIIRFSKILSLLVGESAVDSVMEIQHTLVQKFLLVSVFPIDALRILIEFFASLPESSDITCAILLCLARVSANGIQRSGLAHLFISGIDKYLDSSLPRTRLLGMVTAECFSKIANDTSTLDFELGETEEVRFLRSLAVPPPPLPSLNADDFDSDPHDIGEVAAQSVATGDTTKDTSLFPSAIKCDDDDVNLRLVTTSEEDPDEIVENVRELASNDSDSDSTSDSDDDDDLQPYNLREDDVPVSSDGKSLKPPAYIRECVRGLRAADDPDKIEVALNAAESLIRATAVEELNEVGTDIASTLLHLQNPYELDSFDKKRMAALVELTTRIPAIVSGFLIEEFYEGKQSTGLRMDVLTCLALSAARLSAIPEEAPTRTRHTAPAAPLDIVAERIKANTRRFSRKSLIAPAKTHVNRFAPVAGKFFFPLVGRFQSPSYSQRLFEGDTAILLVEKFLTTAGILVGCA